MNKSVNNGQIRPMELSDVIEVIRIELEDEASSWSDGQLNDSLSSGALGWVFTHEGQIVGHILGRLAGDVFEILTIAVDPVYRRRGMASALFNQAMGLYEKIYLEVRASNIAAIHLYQYLGFKEVDRRKGYYRKTGEDAVVMAWGLD